jgi:ABC-type branched-subunit amino acid transport system ATPase component
VASAESGVIMNGAAPRLAVRDVGHAFGGFRVLARVAFDVPRGGLVGLIGPNGSGKTTLFNIISGFIAPLDGAVVYNGQDLLGKSVQERSRAGLVRTFQTPKIFENLTVLENVMVGCYKRSRAGIVSTMLKIPAAAVEMAAIRERAAAVCERFGLSALREHLGSKLTAGQRRNLELARACVGEPLLLMLDEPSAGLSTEEIETLQAHLVALNKDGLSILLVSHDMELMDVAERVHVLSFGEIIASGTMQEMKRDRSVQEVYLGT